MNWFKVLPDDDGIRPAGRPDQCFYCRQMVGDFHKRDCVICRKDVACTVHVEGRPVLNATIDIPAAWNPQEFYSWSNLGSWCKSNLSNGYLSEEDTREFESWFDPDECACPDTEIKYVSEDPRPFVHLIDGTRSYLDGSKP